MRWPCIQTGSFPICYDRTNYEASVYRYGLYDNSGNRINLSSGFPVEYNSNSNILQGWMGFYDLWLPNNLSINHGDPITKINRQDGTTTLGTLVVLPGRLESQSVQTKTLAQLAGTPLSLEPILQNIPRTTVRWDSTTEQFFKVSVEVCDQNNHCYRNPITPQTAISDSDLRNNFLGQNFALNIGIDGLAGGGFTQLAMKNNNHQPITPSNTSTLGVWTKTLIPPTQNSSNLTLYCYHNCPLYNAGNSQWEMKYPVWDNSGTPYNYLTYTFDRLASNSTYRLLDPNNTPYIASNQESFWLGDLVTTPVANINDLYNGNTSLRYTWRSSQNPWDQFITPLSLMLITVSAPLTHL